MSIRMGLSGVLMAVVATLPMAAAMGAAPVMQSVSWTKSGNEYVTLVEVTFTFSDADGDECWVALWGHDELTRQHFPMQSFADMSDIANQKFLPGTHTLKWIANTSGGGRTSDNFQVFARVSDTGRVAAGQYLVIDVSGGAAATSYPVSYVDYIDVTDDEYKTDKIVLRELSNGSYWSVYEITQQQYESVTNATPSSFGGNPMRPVESVSWETITGNGIYGTGFIAVLRRKASLSALDLLPFYGGFTYACGAGATNDYNDYTVNNGLGGIYGGSTPDPVLDNLAWYTSNSEGATHDVGGKQPNAWGLYDIHGNVWELSKEKIEGFSASDAGGFGSTADACRPGGPSYADYYFNSPDLGKSDLGFRLSLPAVQGSATEFDQNVSNTAVLGTVPEFIDYDSDNIPDAFEDNDGDSVPDTFEDLDCNGISDAFEDNNTNGVPDMFEDNNTSGIPDGFEDNDSNGVPDCFEDLNANGKPDCYEALDMSCDTDGDGLTNQEEHTGITSYALWDTDGDSLSDYDEIINNMTDPLLWDTDGDGMSDSAELNFGFNPLVPDISLYVTLDNPVNGASLQTTPITISGRIANYLVEQVFVSTDGGATWPLTATITGLTWSVPWSPAVSDAYSIVARDINVYDVVEYTTPVTVYYRPNYPEVNITAPLNNAHIQGTVDITGTAKASAAFGWTDYFVAYRAGSDITGDTGWTELTRSVSEIVNGVLHSGWDVSGLAEGFYAVRLRGTDASGFVMSTCHVVVEVDHDATPPVAPSALTIEGGVYASAVANGNPLQVLGTASPDCYLATAEIINADTQSVLKNVITELALHQGGAIHGPCTLPGSITATNVALRISVKDAAGNVGPAFTSNSLPVDNAAPEVVIVFPVNGAILPQDVIYATGTATDLGVAGLDNVEYKVDAGLWQAATGVNAWRFNWTPTADQQYTLYIRALDNLGNAGQAQTTVTVNSLYPSAYITVPLHGADVEDDTVVNIMGTAWDAQGLDYYIVQYAPGVSPVAGWTDITPAQVTTPVQNGLLVQWDTTGVQQGIYTIRLFVMDASGNFVRFDSLVNIVFPECINDLDPPVITLVGDNPVSVECGDDYTDAGATADDLCDGDLTGNIIVGGDSVNTSVSDTYTITYNVSDTTSNAAVEVTRTVNVVDTTPPVITLLGDTTVYVEFGTVYTDAGATALDICDGDITANIITAGDTVNTSILGSYTITYNVSDAASKAAVEVIRTVIVTGTVINSIAELQLIGNDPSYPLNGNYVLGNDIDASATVTWNSGAGFEPIGNDANPFIGVFDGQNYTITEYYSFFNGVFGYVAAPATIHNLGIVSVEISGGGGGIGGLVGVNYGGTVSECYVTGTISTDALEVGGLVGTNYDGGTVSGCYATCTISGDDYVGGLVGMNYEGMITGCYATGAVTGGPGAGGLVGGNLFWSTITQCYAAGDVSSYHTSIGGLVGENGGLVTACYATGTVTGLDEATGLGGLVGDNGGTIINCYATGYVSGYYETGGLVGNSNSEVVTACFWDINATNQAGSVGGGTGLNTSQMLQDTEFVTAGWDFTTVWSIIPDTTYPWLQVLDYSLAGYPNPCDPDKDKPTITVSGLNPINIECGTSYTDAGATAFDYCEGDLTTSILLGGDTVNTGVLDTYSITYNVSDIASNAALEVTRTVNVVDTTAPVITLLGDNPATVECNDSYTDAGATVLDACDGDLTSIIVIGGDTVDTAVPGTYSITYNVSDDASNAAIEVTRTVNVVDTTAPVITINGSNPVTVQCGSVYTDAGATASDSCYGNLTGSIVTVNPVNTTVKGSYTVAYNVNDSASNAATQVTRTVNVVDTTAPVITRLGNSPMAVECGAVYTDAGATAIDSCDGTLTSSIVTVNPVNTTVTGSYTVTYNVTDSASNAALEVTRTINVVDTTLPVITMLGDNPITLECGDNYTDAGATATDTCDGDLTSSLNIVNPVDENTTGVYTVTYNVSDNASNAALEVTRTVNVVDTTVPMITLVGDAAVIVECGDSYIDAGTTADDACDGDLTSSIITNNTVNTAIPAIYTVTYNVADTALNNAVEVTRTVTVADTTAPVITLLGDNPVGVECGGTYSDAGATATDSCEGDLTANIIAAEDTVDTSAPGSYTITYNVSDTASNAATEVTRTVNITDTTKPVITLLGNNPVIVECGSSYTDAGATVIDACSGNLTAGIVIVNPVNPAVPGTYTVTYNASDASSNAAVEVTRTVNVTDTTAPVITPLGNSPVTVECGGTYTDAGATASDVCDGDLTSSIVTVNSVNPAVPGSYMVTYNVSDSAANAALEVVRTVNVSDTIAPVLSLVGDTPVTMECGINYTDAGATASDNCDGDITGSIVVGGDTVNTAVSGTYTITYNVSDAESNAALEVVRTVNVVDTTDPVITVLGNNPKTVECGSTYADSGATANDTCDGNVTSNIVTLNQVNATVPGAYTVTYNVSDYSANAAAQMTRTVNVVDTQSPIITRNGSNSVMVQCGSVYIDAGATAADTCTGNLTASIVTVNPVNTALAGIYTVTYNVTDAAGNAAAQITRTVNVVDTVSPVITRIGPASVTIDCGAVYTDAGATATDVCDGNLSAAIDVSNPVNTSSPGIYTVRYDVTDNAGNVATAATRTVTVSLCDEGNAFSGVVIDDRTEQLLSNVLVSLHLPQDEEVLNTWTTGADGAFVFVVDDPYQQYDLQFEKSGYEPLWLSGLLPSTTLMPRMRQQTVVPIPANLTVMVSAGQVILRWDAPLGGDITEYYVYRDGEKIISSPVTDASYIDRTVTPGATYTYQVSAINSSGAESLPSSPVTVSITLGLWIPQVSGAPGTEVYTTLNITNARDIEATTSAGFTIKLEYDPDVIAGITAEAGVILRTLNTSITDEGNGLLTLSALNPGAPLQLTGEGKLFDLHITLLAGAELGCSELKTPLLDFFDTNGNRIPAALIGDTQICAGDAQLLGDLDADELLTAGDAVLSMLISSRQITPTEYQRMVGDVNGDGRLDAADTVLIHRLASNWRMNPLEDETVLADLLAGLAATVSLPEVEARPGTQVTLGLNVGPLAGLAGADFVIAQDELLLAGSGAAQFPGLPESFSRTVNQQPHGFRATISSPEALGVNSLEASLLTVTFTVSPEATPGMLLPVTIANAGLKGQYGEDYDWYTTVSLVSGAVRVIGDAEGEGEGEGEPEEGEPVEGEPAEGEGEPLTPDEIKQTLLNQFAAADTNGDGQLSFEEAFAVLNGLTQEQFDALDAKNSAVNRKAAAAAKAPATAKTSSSVTWAIGCWLG
jgi:large repetitive protein